MKLTEEIIKDFSRYYCYICKKEIILMCSQPKIVIGGCCVGVIDKGNNKIHIVPLSAHLHCYNNKKKNIKTMIPFSIARRCIEK